MKGKVQIDLDDTKGFFKYLAKNPETKSIFDTIALGTLLELHQLYGTKFTLLCMYESKGFSLDQVSDRYRSEFQKHCDWLHFGFHGFREDSDYTDATAEQIYEEYRKTMGEIGRITGITDYADTICLHGFTGNKEVCRMLKRQGIRCFLTADDERCSYYLTDMECRRIETEGSFWDEKEGIMFIRRLTRLEHNETPAEELQRALDTKLPLIDLFTHEWLLDREVIRDRLHECCRWIYSSGIQ